MRPLPNAATTTAEDGPASSVAEVASTSAENALPEPAVTAVTHESKRKQAHPHKSIPQPIKKRGRKRKLNEDAEAEAAPTAVATTTTSPSKRGRPRRNAAVDDSNAGGKATTSADSDAAAVGKVAVDVSVSPSKINSQLKNSLEVHLERIDVLVSPVKIVQEKPLVLEATQNSTSVARKIDFPAAESGPSQQNEPSVDADDVDVIESSQSSDTNDLKQRAKRRKKGLESSATKPVSTRPSKLLYLNRLMHLS